MQIEPFGEITYEKKSKRWFGDVENIAPDNKIELTIEVHNESEDIVEKVHVLRQFAKDYDLIMTNLWGLAYAKYKNTQWAKTLAEIKEMYFLTAVTLKTDNKTWWLVLEPDYKVDSIYNHLLRFTMTGRNVIWSNFEI